MGAETLKSKKAREIVERFTIDGKLSINKTGLARILLKDNPLLYDSVEVARNCIRYITGNQGNKNRTIVPDKSQIMESKNINIYSLGDEIHNDITPYVIPKKYKHLGIIPDPHIPYQDNRALTAALNYMKAEDIDCLLLNGDIIDCYQGSDFVRDPGMRDLKFELDATRNFLKALRKEFPKCLILFKEGNHELRWKRFLMKKAPEVFNMSEFKLDVILNMNEIGVQWIDNKKIIKAGNLNIIHGHEYPGAYSPVSPARGYYNKAMTNVLAGHNHQSSEHLSKDLNNVVSGAWSTGCLCELHPDYMPYNKWNHGFAMVDIYENGNFRVKNKRIENGEIL